jgi:hypothetical protein
MDWFTLLVQGDPGLVGGFSHVGRRMAEFMNQTDVRRLSSVVHL